MAWITIEGINGAGKTYLARAAARRLGSACRLVPELTDLDGGELPARVVAALAAGGGTFLRGGHPAAETLALTALKVHTFENELASNDAADLMLEDRGIDTVALYQAAILTSPAAPLAEPLAVADRIYATAARWRPLPDRTVLITDNLPACAARFEERAGEPLSGDDRVLLARVAELYLAQAARDPRRFVLTDRRGREGTAVVDQICRICRESIRGLACRA